VVLLIEFRRGGYSFRVPAFSCKGGVTHITDSFRREK